MKPLTITSTTHAAALSTYAALALLGGAWATDAATAGHLIDRAGQTFTALWALTVLVAGLVALVSALVTPHVPIPKDTLTCEGVACVALAVCTAIYGWSIYGANAHATMVMCGCFFVGTAWRAWQISRELRRIRHALEADETAETLADPED